MTTEVDLQDLELALSAGAPVLDVRESDEYAAGHVPGVRLLPLGALPARQHELPRDRTVYLVCQSGSRSEKARALLARAGYDARSVAGGTAAWARSGRPIETGAPPA